MFAGTYQHTIDDKGRLFIPARFRTQENQRFFVTRGLDKCLWVFLETEWEKMRRQLSELNTMQADIRALHRLFFSGATEAVSDKQGRINLPQRLIDYAGLAKEAMVIGADMRFEIWDAERWRKYEEGITPRFEEMAEKIVLKPARGETPA